MSPGDDFSLFELFQEEARANTAALSQGLLELEADAANPRRIEPLMRAAHSLKGASRIVGIDLAVKLAHVMEDVFVAAQEGRITITPPDIDQLLRGTDLLAELGGATEVTTGAWQSSNAAEITTLEGWLAQVARGERPTSPAQPASAKEAIASAPGGQAQPASPATSSPALPDRVAERSPAVSALSAVAIPAEPLAAPEEPSMLDVFHEEVRSHALAIQQGILARLTSPGEASQFDPLIAAAHSIRGAARLVDHGFAAQLAETLETYFTRARSGGATLGATESGPLATALEIFVELLAQTSNEAPEWSALRAADVGVIAERLSSSTNTASQNTAVSPAPQSVPVQEEPVEPSAEVFAEEPPAGTEVAELAPAAPAAVVATEAAAAVVRVSAQSLNRLMGLAGESLVQARWLQPFSTALLKLKKHQDDVAVLLDNLSHALPRRGADDDTIGLVQQARQGTAHCRQMLTERLQAFDDHAAQAEDLNTRLYHEVIVSRMRPFGDGAQGFPRLIRDMARQLDKQVRLEIDGLETNVDRDVLEKLEAPLTHLLRNALDHGIESPDVRQAAGKPAAGLIQLEVRHRAGMLAITITDDGRGMDVDRIRQKIVERGLSTAALTESMTPAEVLEFLFLPGFSTADKVTEYSGRGVGLGRSATIGAPHRRCGARYDSAG